MHFFFVRIGSLAEVFAASSPGGLNRGQRVLVRTGRGIQLGEIVRSIDGGFPEQRLVKIIRPTTNEDELLIARLERHKRQAVESCRAALAESGSTAILLDVDQLFDGGTLVMHFLGPVDKIAESVTRRIVDRYESIVRTRHFAKLLRDGCGPGCGTGQGTGCGSECSGCAVATACGTS